MFDTQESPSQDDATGGTTEAEDDPASSSSGDDPSGAPGSGVDPDGDVGCDAVDFLFVIDNSGSMADEQQQLIDSVPGFVSAIEQRLPPGTGTYHIMVTDSDPWVYGGCEESCTESAACEMQSADGSCDCGYPCALRGLCTDIGDYVCGQTQPMDCEDVLGAGITHPRGRDASNVECEFASNRRFIASGEPDLAASFDCAARVGTNSSLGEKPMEAMVQAVAGDGDVAACNEGFLRDNAVLVVVIITDEDDNGPNADDLEGDSMGSPQAWRDALVAAKNGNEDAIITMALIGDGDSPTGICDPLDPATFEGAEPAPRIREFAGLFGAQGIVGSVCAPSYVEFFESAVETIGMACDEFVPVG
ncbi:MAG: hypothetical protein AAGA54_13195 [Myxococcota bacterium]